MPPTLVRTTPTSGATGVPTSAAVEATFSEAVASASVTSATFSVAPQGATTPLLGTFTVAGPQVTFQPSAPLTPGTTFAVTITTGITDLTGNALASGGSFTFTTVSNGAPVASAGTDQDVGTGEAVGLDGTASADPEGEPLTYAWTQTGGPAVALAGATTATPSFTAPAEVCTLRFTLTVADPQNGTGASSVLVRVWRDKTKVVLVSAATGDDANGGALGAPVKTIGRGIALAGARGAGAGVYVAAGTYGESLIVPAGLAIYGGFSDGTWERASPPTSSPTIVSGGTRAVTLSNANGAVLDGLAITSAPATGSGESSIGVLVSSSTDVGIAGCAITAGDGFTGASGASGTSGNAGAPGSGGGAGHCDSTGPSAAGAGGTGGWAVVRGGDGGLGGYETCDWFSICSQTFTDGTSGTAGSSAGVGGAGGAAGRTSGASGTAGSAGNGGSTGAAGVAGLDYGRIDGTGYLPAGSGGAGGSGTAGGGGGGGGGSAGQWGIFTYPGAGNGGGGGGAGGAGGFGGQGGTGGGGSFGIVAYGSAVTVTGGSITTGDGGNGGSGGSGGPGGQGGEGGTGNSSCANEIGASGGGGRGGNGGWGGQGGGGSGGPSLGVAYDPTTTATLTGTAVTVGTAGLGGTPNGPAGIAATTLQR